MTLYEYTCKDGLKEILNFIWNYDAVDQETDEVIFARLGYEEQPARLYSSRFANWINIYKNFRDNEYEYLIKISNHIYSQYVACKCFVEFMDFMRLYLPVISQMNDIAVATTVTEAKAGEGEFPLLDSIGKRARHGMVT